MNDKQLLADWTKLCLTKKNSPICLITITADGIPHVFTNHSKELMAKVYEHLLNSGGPDEQTILHGREN